MPNSSIIHTPKCVCEACQFIRKGDVARTLDTVRVRRPEVYRRMVRMDWHLQFVRYPKTPNA
jgi:hypothetical protein